MKDIAQQLNEIIGTVEPQLSRMNDDDLRFKTSPIEWSKKEILGHLIDSAANNHQRFVRAVYQVADQFPTYDQNKWIKIQRYNEIPWTTLVAFWSAYNNHLSHVIEYIPEDAESSPCNIGEEEPAPLDYIINDYLRHLRHHLEDILNG
ncbi:MAG: DinB family protein [Desulfobacteraceae bacterium]|nr:DinB family protein [Desulfobacteraceae bacterium]